MSCDYCYLGWIFESFQISVINFVIFYLNYDYKPQKNPLKRLDSSPLCFPPEFISDDLVSRYKSRAAKEVLPLRAR
jgi:hypothetical protein